jgi:fluoroquinolone transport system permease protein
MRPLTLFKNDIKQIMRDPIMALLMFAPLMLIVVFKLIEIFLYPYLQAQFDFDMMPYSVYVLSFILLMNSGTLGIVIGFMMLDERDGNISQLLEITPLGRSGYLINRLSFACILSALYGLLSLAVFTNIDLSMGLFILASLLSAIYTAIIGLLIFSAAEDKVKGLTFAKGLNALAIFAFADLFAIQWFTIVSWFFPSYWISMILKSPNSFTVGGLALVVHVVWLGFLVFRYSRREG